MKKVLVILIIVITTASAGFAQKGIGLRWGMQSHLVNGMGAELSYQQAFDNNRLELDFATAGIFYNGDNATNSFSLSLIAIYHWKFNIANNFNWYIGPAALGGLYFVQFDKSFEGPTLGLGGQLGIEYDFSSKGVPLQVSLDTRPMFNLLSPQESRGYNVSACFSLRYSF